MNFAIRSFFLRGWMVSGKYLVTYCLLAIILFPVRDLSSEGRLDARYEKVREDGVIRSQAVLIAIGINWEGQRQVTAVELANRESATSWEEFLVILKQWGLHRIEFVVSDAHAELRRAIGEILRETLTFYPLPRAHHKHLKSTNMLKRLKEEIKRRTPVVRILSNVASCERGVRALCVETHEAWLEAGRYLNMVLLGEQKKELLKIAA